MTTSSMNFRSLALVALLASYDASVSAFVPADAPGLVRHTVPSTRLNILGERQRVGERERQQQRFGERERQQLDYRTEERMRVPVEVPVTQEGNMMQRQQKNSIVRTGGNLARGAMEALAAPVTKKIWDTVTPVKVQGDSLKTWSFSSPEVERVQVYLKTEGRPMHANVELWNGPDNCPQKMGVWVEDGSVNNFRVVVETPRSGENVIAVRNTGEMAFPLEAFVEAEDRDYANTPSDMNDVDFIQGGGALKTYSVEPSVNCARVMLRTDGYPLNARIELLSGPNTNKQVIEVYLEDGLERTFCVIVDTPGAGNVFRIVNTSPMEFPMTAQVETEFGDISSAGGAGASVENLAGGIFRLFDWFS